MAGRVRNSYHRYYGRSRGSLVLKVVLILLALLVAAALVFLFVLDGRIERTDNGLRLMLPGSADYPSEPQPSQPGEDPIIIIQDPEPTPTPSEPEESNDLEPLRAVEVTAAQLLDGTAAQTVADAGGNAAVVTVKNAYGRLSWQSGVGLAAELGVNAQDDRVAQAVAELAGTGGLRLVARVSCFRDQALVRGKVGGPLMTRGGNVWYDQQGLCWVSAADSTVRSYLAALCTELAGMGFDEILLECAGFPDAGEVHVLAESDLCPADRAGPAAQFLQEVRTALAQQEVTLSVLTTAEAVTGENAGSGITAAALAQYADRVWLAPAALAEDPVQALQEAGLEGAGRVVLLDDAAADSWAQLS